MQLLALSPEISDRLTVWGFVFTALGTVVGIVGFWYTIYQVRKVKAAAEAAEAAANHAVAESKRSFARFVGTSASRLLSELQRATNEQDWKYAAARAHDLAEMLGTLPDAGTREVGLVAELRAYGQKFAERAGGAVPKFAQKKWIDLVNSLHAVLDGLRAPFREVRNGEVASPSSRFDVQETGPESPQPNSGEGG